MKGINRMNKGVKIVNKTGRPFGEPVRMLYFKLTKNSKDLLAAEKSKFHKEKPATRSQKRSTYVQSHGMIGHEEQL